MLKYKPLYKTKKGVIYECRFLDNKFPENNIHCDREIIVLLPMANYYEEGELIITDNKGNTWKKLPVFKGICEIKILVSEDDYKKIMEE